MTRRDAWAAALWAAFLAAVFGNAWFTGRTFFARDLTFLFQPLFTFNAQSLQAGSLPLWNPYVSGGVYWVGQPQTGFFYPLNVFFWVFPFAKGLKLFHAAHLFAGGFGGYLAARALRAPRWAALLAACLWSLNGFWRARLEFPSLLAALTWAPWGLLAVEFLRRGRRGVLAAALVAAFSWTAGYWPQMVWGWVLAAVWGLRKPGKVLALRAAAALGLGGLLSAAQILPGLDLIGRSARRAGEIGRDVAGLYAFKWGELLGFIFPPASAMSASAYTGEKFFWLGCFYVGAAGAAAALWAAKSLPPARRWLWAGLFILGAALVAGERSPLYRFLYDAVPFFRWVRYPGQYAFWMTAAAAAVVTEGFAGRRKAAAAGLCLLAAAAAELAYWGAGLAPVINADYFHDRPGWVGLIQGQEGHFFPSPRATQTLSARGRTWEETWGRFRAGLPNLGGLPYRIRSLNAAGFSLNPQANERALSRLYGAPSLRAALPLFPAYDVRWIALTAPSAEARLAVLSEDPWHLEEDRSWRPGVDLEKADGTRDRWASAERPDRYRFSGAAAAGCLRPPIFWDPGWRAFSAGRAVPRREEDDRVTVLLEEKTGRVDMLFAPSSWRWGLLISLAAMTAVAAAGFRFRRTA